MGMWDSFLETIGWDEQKEAPKEIPAPPIQRTFTPAQEADAKKAGFSSAEAAFYFYQKQRESKGQTQDVKPSTDPMAWHPKKMLEWVDQTIKDAFE